MAEEIKVPKYQQFAGSPDIFETATGKVITETDAQAAGLFTPKGLSADVQKVSSPRPGVKTEEDFERFGGLDIGSEPKLSLDINTTGDGVVSDTSEPRAKIDTLKDDLDRARAGLAEFGIEPPDQGISETVDEILNQLRTRQSDLDKRREEDIASAEKGFEAAEGELRLGQEEAFAQAEGRTRIGGFITRMEIQDLERMQRGHRIELATLQAQKQDAILQASRAYNDQNFDLTMRQLEIAKNSENEIHERNRQYFNDVKTFQSMSTPLSRATEAMQNFAIDAAIKYSSAFADLEPADWLEMTPAEVQRRVLNSDEFKQEQEKVLDEAPKVIGSTSTGFFQWNPQTRAWESVVGPGTGPGSTNIPTGGGTIGGKIISAGTLNVIEGSRTLNDFTSAERQKMEAELRELGFFSASPPEWFKNFAEEQQQATLTPQALTVIWDEFRQGATKLQRTSTGGGSIPSAWLVPKEPNE